MPRILHRKSSVAGKKPTASQLVEGEIAVNTNDGKAYTLANGTVKTLAGQWEENGDNIYYSDGNVGIGTDAPETTLDVNGTFRYGSSGIDASDADAANRPGFYAMEDALSATNYPPHFLNGCASLVTIAGYNVNNWTQLAFAQNSPFAPAFRSKRAGDIGGWREFVVTDDNGNVGIGMSPLSGDRLQVAGPSWFSRGSTSDQGIRLNSDSNRTSIVAYGVNKPFEIQNADDTYGQINFFHGSAKKLSLELKPSGDATFNGKVGIGESSPATKLEAKGNTGSGSDSEIVRITSTDSVSRMVLANSVGQGGIDTNGDIIRFTNTSSNTERMRIDASGHVFVKDDTNGDLRLGEVNDIPGIYSGDGKGMVFRSDVSGGVDLFTWKSGANNRMVMDEAGNVTVSGSVRFNTLFNPVYWHTDNNFYTEVDGVDGTLDFHTFNGVRFYPTNASQTRPTLEVQGDATFSGTVNAGPFVSNGATNSGGFVSVLGGESDTALVPVDGSGVEADGTISLGRIRAGADFNKHTRWKDALFSGTVYANKLQAAPLDGGTYEPTMVIERVHDDAFGTKPVIYSPVYKGCGLKFQSGNSPAIYPTDNMGKAKAGGLSFGSNAYRFSQGHFNSVYSGGRPVSTTRELIETLSTLRTATQDETTLEGLRDAIGNAVGGLIEKFEAMQSVATQEIEA